MKLTNKLNLPQSIFNYAYNQQKRDLTPFRLSVTEIINPIREIALKRKYYAEISEDVVDYIPALFGTAVHSILEDNAPEGVETEKQIEINFGKWTLSGRIDLLDVKNKLIGDYKTCSVSKIMKGDFEDWRLQGLLYAYILYFGYAIEVRKLQFYALMKDWSKVKSTTSQNYPSSAFYVWEYDISDSDFDYALNYIRDKISALEIADVCLPECSDDDKWKEPDEYAVIKNGGIKASYITKDKSDAENYLLNKLNNEGRIELREKQCLKCDLYCPVRDYCKGEK